MTSGEALGIKGAARRALRAASGLTVAGALVVAAFGGDKAASSPPFVLPHGEKDISLVPSGSYTLDPNHVAVIARVSHLGFSLSVFRFDRARAVLEWDRDNPVHSRLRAVVETGSIATNVPDFASQLAGPKYLNSAIWPEATFVSRAFRQTDGTHGQVDGDFTLMGKTRPVTFEVTLIGAGPGFAGGPVMGHVIGIEAQAEINPQDYGLPAIFSEPIQIVVDTEFDKKPH